MHLLPTLLPALPPVVLMNVPKELSIPGQEAELRSYIASVVHHERVHLEQIRDALPGYGRRWRGRYLSDPIEIEAHAAQVANGLSDLSLNSHAVEAAFSHTRWRAELGVRGTAEPWGRVLDNYQGVRKADPRAWAAFRANVMAQLGLASGI